MLMELLTPENIKSYFAAKDYKFFDTPDKRLNLNIIGVRRDSQGSNTFDDFLLVMYREEDFMINLRWQATTDPGKYWLMNPMNPKGTAVLVPGQYRGTWQLGKHQNNYEALVRSKPVKVSQSRSVGVAPVDIDSKVALVYHRFYIFIIYNFVFVVVPPNLHGLRLNQCLIVVLMLAKLPGASVLTWH